MTGLASTADGAGYWETTEDGSVWAFGDATGGFPLTHDLSGNLATGIASTPSGIGYWLVDTSANIYTYGNATPYPLNP
jgi:hypothetical protein